MRLRVAAPIGEWRLLAVRQTPQPWIPEDQSQQEVGPTMVGDEHSDPSLMSFLGATKRNMLGNH
ncbi:PREDICTED: GTP cyclohydrolase 1 feedback regulatory protein-like, partial [Phaethon lepturus]|uniref:GTP cyclohydrolase 1 feedback regulatory protein-like n=1 Tax=Phaethon lepturus TaxID=97097 RepID=UPI0005308927